MSTLFTALWVAWIVAFFVVEGVALWQDHKYPASFDKGFTLSSHFRRWFSVKSHVGRTVFVLVTGAFATLFALHIVNGGWF